MAVGGRPDGAGVGRGEADPPDAVELGTRHVRGLREGRRRLLLGRHPGRGGDEGDGRRAIHDFRKC